jgi:glycosyltransferase involved in cell wall biosynthesis
VRILLLHNSYQFSGGEDRAVDADRALLALHGHETKVYLRTYNEIARRTPVSRLGLAADVLWSRKTYQEVRELVSAWRPDVAHFHNIFPLISPSAYDACHAEGIPVVQTLHNYRLLCAAGTLLRDGKVCELCVGHLPFPAVRFNCYRGSRSQSVVMAAALGGHSALGTWRRKVDAYIALTEFGRQMFVRGGLPANRLFVRPNAVESPAEVARYSGPNSAIFVGRLSPEKGIGILLDAWEHLSDLRLTVVGNGPLLPQIRERVGRDLPHVEIAGEVPHEEVLRMIHSAGMLVFPSVWYEGLPYVALEAIAAGVPVVASDLGAQAEVITDGINGLLFASGDAGSLGAAVRRLHGSPELAYRLSEGARRVFLERYSADRSYEQLIEVYRHVGAS